MNKKDYISNVFRKILKEDLEEKAESLMNKLNYDKTLKLNKDEEFDYVQEGSQGMCEQCGGEIKEGEDCEQCGAKGEVMELGGMDDGHPRFGNKNFSKMSKREKDMLMGDRDYEDSFDDEDEDDFEEFDFKDYDDDFEEFDFKDYDDDFEDLDIETDWSELEEDGLDEKLYGKQSKIDKNKNGRIDDGDFKMLRKQQDEEKQLYEVEFEKEIEEGETEEGNAFTGALADAKKKGDDEFEVDGKKYNVKESILFTENDLIDLIEKIVKEEKTNIKVSEPKGYAEYEKAHKADGKENKDYLKSVAKKMTDYLKDSSDNFSKYEMKETQKFPTENGGMKAKRKKYTPSKAVDEYIEAFSYPGQTNLVYDEIKPNDKNIEGQLKGSSKNGNAQVDKDGKALGNVVPSEVGERFYKNFKDNLYGQEQMSASYKRQPQPVDQAGEETERGSLKAKKAKKTSQSVLNKLEESTDKVVDKKLNEEYNRIQQLMGYNRKTQ
jgi:hypothetical protein